MVFPIFSHDLREEIRHVPWIPCAQALRNPQRGASGGLRGGRRAGHGARHRLWRRHGDQPGGSPGFPWGPWPGIWDPKNGTLIWDHRDFTQ